MQHIAVASVRQALSKKSEGRERRGRTEASNAIGKDAAVPGLKPASASAVLPRSPS